MATLTKQPAEWIHSAPVQASATRELDASPGEVFEALCDHESWPEWFETIKKVERFGSIETGVGSNRRVFINDRIAIDEEFNVWEPNTAWGFTILSMKLPVLKSMNELVTIEDLGEDRSKVTYTMGIAPKALFVPLVKVARKQLSKNLGAALDNLGPHIATQRENI